MRWNIKQRNAGGHAGVILRWLLENRGITGEKEIEKFLNPDWDTQILDPFSFKDMGKAVQRIEEAITRKQEVVIHGDYDTDGVCSSIILNKIFGELGLKTNVFLPHREKEGYGLNPNTVKYLIEQRYDLVICADCGSSNYEEVDLLEKAGINVIILDHHFEPSKIPPAYAILNPQFSSETYSFKDLAATGVVFKLVQALVKKYDGILPKGFEKWYLDLVAIATITDMAVLKGENRVFVKYGLLVLNKTKWPGLKELVKIAGSDIGMLNEWSIAFQIGPRVNAAGRVDHASQAYELLNSSTEEEAYKWAKMLDESNSSRQKLTKDIVDDAVVQVRAQLNDHYVLCARGNWPIGLVGLVSSRITEKFYRPSIVVGKSEARLAGSGRSIAGFNMIEAVEKCSQHLDKFGGHPQACGFSIRDEASVEKFWLAMDRIAKSELRESDLEKMLEVDMELEMELVNKETWRLLSKLPPYGIGNPQPRFVVFGVVVASLGAMGSAGQHYWFTLAKDGISRRAVVFEWENNEPKIEIGSKVDVVYEIMQDNWLQRVEYKMKVVDIRLSQ